MPHRSGSGAGIKYQQKMTTIETWTFYLRRLFLFARLSYYFIAVLRLTKSSTLLSAPVLASTQQVSIWSLKMLLIYFSQNGHFWNGVTGEVALPCDISKPKTGPRRRFLRINCQVKSIIRRCFVCAGMQKNNNLFPLSLASKGRKDLPPKTPTKST